MSKASDDVLVERERQKGAEGYTEGHDSAEHWAGELARAAACYAISGYDRLEEVNDATLRKVFVHSSEFRMALWPWTRADWKPKSYRRDLVRAAALLIAEIERLDRLEVQKAAVKADEVRNAKAILGQKS